MEKVKILKSYNDMQLNRRTIPGEIIEVTKERAAELVAFRTRFAESIAEYYVETPKENHLLKGHTKENQAVPPRMRKPSINLNEPLKSPEEVEALVNGEPTKGKPENEKPSELVVKSKSQQKREAIMQGKDLEEVELDANLKPVAKPKEETKQEEKPKRRSYGARKKDISNK